MTTTPQQAIKTRIKDFVSSAVDLPKLTDDDNLFESGIVNSLFAVQLMTFLEKAFAIEIGIDDLDMENFKSLNATTAFVITKIARTYRSSETEIGERSAVDA